MRTYPGKLLVFGEYVILLGAPALSAPITLFSGHWKQDASLPYAENLLRFAASDAAMAVAGFNASALEKDVHAGWRFASNIPQGYGLGSSGALVAGLYDRYGTQPLSDPSALLEVFARMESHFHGQSSGMDPLTSYLNVPLQTGPARMANSMTWSPWNHAPPRAFLLDTELPRQTAPLVARFQTLMRDANFRHQIEQAWMPAHLAAMEAWVLGETALFWPAVRSLSKIQFELADFLIPEAVRSIWLEGLRSERFILKLCGAGGGGFILGFERPEVDMRLLYPRATIVYLPDEHRN
jgi:mevalonate kinase